LIVKIAHIYRSHLYILDHCGLHLLGKQLFPDTRKPVLTQLQNAAAGKTYNLLFRAIILKQHPEPVVNGSLNIRVTDHNTVNGGLIGQKFLLHHAFKDEATDIRVQSYPLLLHHLLHILRFNIGQLHGTGTHNSGYLVHHIGLGLKC